MNEKISQYWSILDKRERLELLTKTFDKMPVFVDFQALSKLNVVPTCVIPYLEIHPNEIQSKFQVMYKEYEGDEFELYGEPTFDRDFCESAARMLVRKLNNLGAVVIDLMTDKPVYLDCVNA